MKKIFLKYSFIFLLITIGIIIPLNSDFSYTPVLAINCPAGQYDYFGTCIPLSNNNTTSGIITTPTTNTMGAQTLNSSVSFGKNDFVDSCSWTSVFTGETVVCITSKVVNFILEKISLVLYFSGIFLNYATDFTLNLSETTDSLNIDAGWVAIRDLVNITFIFGLLYIAIQTILGLGDSKKLLASIILCAIFINFSLFFTQVIIDASNMVAIQFYSSITGGGDISDQFMDRLQLRGIYNENGVLFDQFKAQISIGLFGSFFILIAAIVFFFAGILLIVRSAILIFLMVVSPIGFVGSWIPKLKTYGDKWWSELFNQSLVAPVFFMLIWLILKITERVSTGLITSNTETATNTASASFAELLAGEGDAIAVAINFIFLIALLIAALNQAKSLSGNMGQAGAKLLGGAVSGAGGWLGRQTAGKLFARVADSEKFKDIAKKSRVGMLALKGVEGVAKSSFDIRAGVPVISKALETGGAKLEMGRAGGEKGYRGDVERRENERQAEAKLLESKETKGQETARKEAFLASGGAEKDFKTTKQITAERQKTFAETLRKPITVIPFIAKGLTPSGVEGDIKAAGKIEKRIESTDSVGYLEDEIKMMNADLKELLGEALEKEINVEKMGSKDLSKEIRDAVSKLNAKAEVAREDVRAKRGTLSIKERVDGFTAVNLLEKKARDLGSIIDRKERAEDRIGRLKERDERAQDRGRASSERGGRGERGQENRAEEKPEPKKE